MPPSKDTGGTGDDGAMRIDSALVQELAELLSANELTEIEVEDGDRKIRVARHSAAASAPAFVMPAAPAAAGAQPIAAVTATDEEVSGETVKSPMVGTAYMSAEPGAKPFVEVGDVVDEGQTVAIVEAMKLMNQVKADRAGRVSEIPADDGAWVEFEQVLIYLEDAEGDR